MKKLLLALPFVASASWAGTTYISSISTQKAYQQLLSQLSALQPLVFENESYDEGFLQSTAVTVVKSKTGSGDEVVFRLRHLIDHSAIAMDDSGTRVGSTKIVTHLIQNSVPETAQQFIQQHVTNAEPFALETEISLSGHVTNDFILNGVTVEKDNQRIQFDGGWVSIQSNPAGQHFGAGEITAGSFTQNGKTLTVDSSTLEFDLQTIEEHLQTGEILYQIPRIALTDPSGSQFELNNISLECDTNVENDMLNSTAKFSIQTIDSPLPINSLASSTSVNGFSLESFRRYNQEAEQLLARFEQNDTDDFQISDLIAFYQSIYTPGISIDYAIDVSNQHGSASELLNIKVVGDGSSGGYDSVETLGDLIGVFEFENQLKLDTATVVGTPLENLLQGPQAQMLFKHDGHRYSSDIRVLDGTATINGEQMALSYLFGPILDTPLDQLLRK